MKYLVMIVALSDCGLFSSSPDPASPAAVTAQVEHVLTVLDSVAKPLAEAGSVDAARVRSGIAAARAGQRSASCLVPTLVLAADAARQADLPMQAIQILNAADLLRQLTHGDCDESDGGV